MAKKRIFIAFAIEDRRARDLLTGQSLNTDSPFEYTDMSAKEPWDSAWKTNCRQAIQGCDGVIALISKNTANAEGAIWEINCALDEDKPVLGIWAYKDDRATPSAMSGQTLIPWAWDPIAEFIDGL